MALFDSQKHDARLYRSSPARFAFRASEPADVQAWQETFRPALRRLLGLDSIQALLPADFAPRAEPQQVEDLGDYLRETWRLWVEPDVPLPFYLLRPKQSNGRLPLVLTPHGHGQPYIYAGIFHSPQEEASIREGERDIAVQAVREGYVVIAPTARGFGETRNAKDQAEQKLSSCHTLLLHDVLVGRTPIGDRVWDIERLIDWATGRADVDAARIAITGNSGGGTTALFAAACDPRITVAVPSSYFCTFQGSIGSIHHCECNYVPGILTLGEMYDVAGLIAPRPFCAISGVEDPIFPNQHTREAFAALKKVYQAAGVPERCQLYEGQGGHRYYKDGAWPFIRKWFEQAVKTPSADL